MVQLFSKAGRSRAHRFLPGGACAAGEFIARCAARLDSNRTPCAFARRRNEGIKMVLDIFALIVIGILIAAVIWLVVLLGPMPGKLAHQRAHPQADAIGVLGWIGIITLGPAWLAALVWAYTKPTRSADLSERVTALEDELRQLKDAQAGDAS